MMSTATPDFSGNPAARGCGRPPIRPDWRSLVHDEHTRAACDDARDGDEPLLPARQVERRTVGEMLDMQHPQRLLYAGGHLQLAQMLVAWAVRHILGDGVSEQLTLRMLHDIADVAPQGRAFFSGECARPFPVFRRRDR